MITREDLLKRTKAYLDLHGYTLSWLADAMGVNVATVSRWFSGERNIGYKAFERLYSFMKLRIDI